MPVSELRSLLTASTVLEDAHEIEPFRADRAPSVRPGRPLAVVVARSIDDVARTVTFAHDRRIPIVPRGAGTGEAGGATALDGSIVLSTHEMARILSVQPGNQIAVVEPGVSAYALNEAAAPHGLRYAPDPGSWRISTLGGNIATNAGGFRCAKYGSTAQAVLGLTVVTGEGRVRRLGHSTLKGVAGLNLAPLFVGSEGTLGVVVEAVLRLSPQPSEAPVTALAFFPSFGAAVEASIAVSNSGLHPAFVEAMDFATLASIDEWQGSSFTARGHAVLLVQLDVNGDTKAESLADELRRHGAVEVELRYGAAASSELLAVRQSALPAAERLGKVLVEDVAVPRERLPEMVEAIERIAAELEVRILTVAHAADGNLHPTFVYREETPPPAVLRAAELVFAAALRLGGTISGEHGVGVVKRHALALELGDDALELQHRVKAVFDPRGILNPGKAL